MDDVACCKLDKSNLQHEHVSMGGYIEHVASIYNFNENSFWFARKIVLFVNKGASKSKG